MHASFASVRPNPGLVLALALVLRAVPAAASPLFELAGDTLGQAGLQARTLPGSSAAAYFNPALLSDTPAGLDVGFILMSQQIGVSLAGRPGPEFNVPERIENAGHADGSRFDNYPIPTVYLQDGRDGDALTAAFEARPRQGAGSGDQLYTYEGVGLVAKLFEERASLGFHVLIPNGDFTRMKAFYNDEREQYFSNSLHPELYGDRMTAPSIALGLGVRIVEGLSLGVGAALNLQAEVVAPTYVVDTGDLEKILIDLDAKVNVGLSPHFAAAYAPVKRLRFTLTAHAPKRVELTTKFTFLLANGVEQSAGVDFLLNYMPWMVGLGASFDVLSAPDRALTLAATLIYATWHSYVDRHGDEPTAAYPWADTLSPALGLRYQVKRFVTHLDASYTPTPVPPQTGRTNYVDNDRVSTSAGAEIGFSLWGTDMGIGAQLQVHRLMPREQEKLETPTRADGANAAPELVKDEVPDDAQISGEPLDDVDGLQTNNPGWPGFGSQGWIVASSIYLKVAI